MIRSMFFINLVDPDVLPRYERWYWRVHAPQAQRSLGPWLRRYESYRALPPPPEADRIGYYNYRLSELWFDRLEPMPSPAGLIWLPDQARQSGLDSIDDVYGARWAGTAAGAHPPLQIVVPALPTDDVKGVDNTFEHVSYVRWVVAHKFADEIDQGEGEAWFVNVHGPQVAACDEVLRCFSAPEVAPPSDAARPWRCTEYWFETIGAWRAFIDRRDLTPPPGGAGEAPPFFAPYADFVSTFVLERPDWTLGDIRPLP